MMTALSILGLVGWAWFAWSMCRAGADADRKTEALFKDRYGDSHDGR